MFFGNLYFAKYAAAKATGQQNQIEELAPLMSASTTSAATISTASTTASKASKKSASANANLVQLIAPGTTPANAAKLANAYSKAVEGGDQRGLRGPAPGRLRLEDRDDTSPDQRVRHRRAGVRHDGQTHARAEGEPHQQPQGAAAHRPRHRPPPRGGRRLRAGVPGQDPKTRSKAESAYGFPVIAEFPVRGAPSADDPGAAGLEVWTDPTSETAESYRLLRISINFEELAEQAPADPFASAAWQIAPKEPYQAPESGSRKVVMVASADDEETRAIVAANLAAIYSEAGQRVIVISTADIDSRRPPGETPLPVTGAADIEPYLRAVQPRARVDACRSARS